MKDQNFSSWSSWFWLVTMLLIGSVAVASGQKVKNVTVINGQSAEVRPLTVIPEATEPCSPAECEWWNRIRKTNSDLNLAFRKRDEKAKLAAKERFFLLILERREKAYRIPLKDRPPQTLLAASPQYSRLAQKNRIQGKVKLSVLVGDDGIVADVHVKSGPGWGLNESAVQSARQAYFLPAIKDGGFVAHWLENVEVTFALGCVGCRPM